MINSRYPADRTYSIEEIRNIQRALNENTYLIPNRVELALTGEFDEATQKLLKDFQEYRRFEVTGTYTARTSAFLNEFIRDKYLNKHAKTEFNKSLQIDDRVVTAIYLALSGPYGFGPNGRCVIHLDKDLFFKRYQAKYGRGAALKLPLDELSLDTSLSDLYSNHLGRWKVMERAMTLGYEQALESAYYGLGMVSGMKWKALKIRSVYEILGKVQASEADQYELFITDILTATDGILNAVKSRDLISIARHYKDLLPEEEFIKRYRYWYEHQ